MMTSKTSPIRVRTIDHVTIVASDLERSTQFYTDVLGMEQVERPAFGFSGCWFQAGSTQVHLNLEGERAGKAGLPCERGTVLSSGFHYAFEVDDCAAAVARMEELGVPIAEGPKPRPDGVRQFYVHDPDGHLLELFSRPR